VVPAEDRPEMEEGVTRAANAVEAWVDQGIQSAMNQFNADPKRAVQKKLTKPESDRASKRNPHQTKNDAGETDKLL